MPMLSLPGCWPISPGIMHAADGAVAGVILDDLRMHPAGVERFGCGLRGLGLGTRDEPDWQKREEQDGKDAREEVHLEVSLDWGR